MEIQIREKQKAQKTIAVYQPYFGGGGAEAVALWLLEGLKKNYQLTVYIISEVDLEKLNQMYGTKLNKAEIEFKSLFPAFLSNLIHFLISNNEDFKKIVKHLVLKKLKAEKSKYDLVMSSFNGADLGKPGIQYIHYPKVIEGNNDKYLDISKFSLDNLKANLSIANSLNIANKIKNDYGINSLVIYPPVVIKKSDIPFQEKEDAFICSGRLVEAKSPHRVIRILKSVREQGFNIKLYLTGGGGGIYAFKYQRFLRKMIAENSDWVQLYQNLSYNDYAKILYKCKYGIHYKVEPFGISIAEMLVSGAIPFVKKVGGQIEIVGSEHSDLLFSNEEEAVEKIIQVLSHPEKQEQIRQSLQKQQELFSSEKFIENIVKVVDNYFDS